VLNQIVLTVHFSGGSESNQVQLGTFKRRTARPNHSRRHKEPSRRETEASRRRSQEATRTFGRCLNPPCKSY